MTERDSSANTKSMRSHYGKWESAVLRVVTLNQHGDEGTGTAFHIGDGYLATAGHVVQHSVKSVLGRYCSAKELMIKNIFRPTDPAVDLAVLETDCPPGLTQVQIGTLFDGLEDEYHLTKCLLMGYPPIPMSLEPVLVAVEGEVNAVINRYDAPHDHFIISAVPRGGFSGGPVISESGDLIGIMVQSLTRDSQNVEHGFASAISTTALWKLLHDNRIYPGDNGWFLHDVFG